MPIKIMDEVNTRKI